MYLRWPLHATTSARPHICSWNSLVGSSSSWGRWESEACFWYLCVPAAW